MILPTARDCDIGNTNVSISIRLSDSVKCGRGYHFRA